MDSLQQMKEKAEAEQKALEEAQKKADRKAYNAEQEAHEETKRRIKNAPQEIRDCIQKLNEYSRDGTVNWKKPRNKYYLYNLISNVYDYLGSHRDDAVPEYKGSGDNFKKVGDHPSLAWLLTNEKFTGTAWDFIADRLKYVDLFSDYSLDCWYYAFSNEPALAKELVQAAREAKSARDTREKKAERRKIIIGLLIAGVIIALIIKCIAG